MERIGYITVNSKLDWNDNLAAIFEAKLVINRLSSSFPSIVFVSAVDTIFSESSEIQYYYFFYLDIRRNVMAHELIT